MTGNRKLQRRHTAMLGFLAVGMFGFAFALVPLYGVFCELTGINGKTSGRAVAISQPLVDSDRVVAIQFLGRVGKGLPWEFQPTEHSLQVKPGQTYTTRYYVRNRADKTVTGQAVPSVSPGIAALHLKKVECFCFEQQQLLAGEEAEISVRFYVDPELPEEITDLSLSYTMYPVPDRQTAQITSESSVTVR